MPWYRFLSVLIALSVGLPVAAQVSLSPTIYPAPVNTSLGFSVAADIDRDGKPDIISTDSSNPQLLVFYGTGGGKFGSPEFIGHLDGPSGNFAVGDFNNDGKLDILAATGQSHSVDLLINEGNRTFSVRSIPMPDSPNWVAVGDFNNDGKLDFAVSSSKPDTPDTVTNYMQIFFGNGDGGFTPGQVLPLPSFATSFIIPRDLNKDGKIDLVVVGAPTVIFLNNGDGTFTAGQTFDAPIFGSYNSGSVRDLNGDAAQDLVLTSMTFCGPGCGEDTTLEAWINDGTGHFTKKLPQLPDIITDALGLIADLADLNYDGKLDMVFEGDEAGLAFVPGKGNGTFGAVQQVVPNFLDDGFSGLLAHDLKNDGQMDIVSTSPNSILVELNTSAKPDCVPPNSSAVGSTVCSPASGEKVGPTFPVRAAANGPVGILRMEEWLDGKKVFQSLSNQLRNSITASAGPHTLTIVTVDALNTISKKSVSISSISCSAPATAGVRICTPTAGSKVGSPVSVVAASTPPGGTSITAVRLYVDNRAKTTTGGSRLSTSVALAAGLHHLTVVAYESNGHALTSSETITVP
ncbi:MAG TPA: VCBS repeat-containing protein [Candidatus Angelobacter sp.]|nr:VCBS repeat-containing protein [Candidatus Angelobacter sp.]